MKFRFLGTGTSVGVPQIGCKCKVCTSTDPRDKRRRCGAYVRSGDAAFLIDTPPEMRLACVEYGIDKVDAIVLTHAHMDHVAGFDDVRRFNTLNGTMVECDPTDPGANGRTCRCIGKIMKCYAMRETEEQMHRIFPYISTKGGEHGLYRPQIEFDNAESFEIGSVGSLGSLGSIRVERVRVEHGFPCCGYVIGPGGAGDLKDSKNHKAPWNSNDPKDPRDPNDSKATNDPNDSKAPKDSKDSNDPNGPKDPLSFGAELAYISDCHELPEATIERLRGVDTLVLNCLREREHPTHLTVARALEYVGRIAPRRTYLIHMCHDFTHEEWLAKLPKGVEPAYDGLEIEV